MNIFLKVLCAIVLPVNLWAQVGDLIWEDNFNQGQLDGSKWSFEEGTGVNGDWGTGQLDRATGRVENVSFQNDVPGAEDGCLVITTRKEFYIDRNFTSGRINTAGKASWGPGHRIVARVRPKDVLQKGQGFAFWMMPDELPSGYDYIMWPQGGEIDIMEYVGSVPYHNLGGVHYAWFWENNEWKDWNHGHLAAYYSYEKNEVPDPAEPGYGGYPPIQDDPAAGSTAFHNYGIDWYDDRLEFFVDDHVYHIHYLNDGGGFQQDGEDQMLILLRDGKRTGVSEYSNHFKEWFPFEHKMYAILSAGVGGSDTTYGGPVVPEAEFPCSVYIDWVRVFELDNTLGVTNEDSPPVFEVYPNPSGETLHIQLEREVEWELDIFDMGGRKVLTGVLEGSTEIEVSHLRPGVYYAIIRNNSQQFSRKIIIQ